MKRQAPVVIQFLRRTGLCWIAVERRLADVDFFGSQCDVKRIRTRAHGKQEAPTEHKVPDLQSDIALHDTDLVEPQRACHALLPSHFVLVPSCASVGAVEFAVLPGKIFVVQVQPIVHRQGARHDFRIVNDIVRNLSVRQHQRHRIVPGLFAIGTVDGDFRRHLQLDAFGIGFGMGDFGEDLTSLHIGDDLVADAPDHTFLLHGNQIGHEKTAPAVVQQPLDFHLLLEQPIGQAVSF